MASSPSPTSFARTESESYTKICTSLWSELSPAGTIEEAFTTEIMSATWRLRRCRMVEEDIAQIAVLDPMQDPATAAQQKSVDRARAQSVNIMNRCINTCCANFRPSAASAARPSPKPTYPQASA